MFHSLFITTESGICIYAQHFIKSKINNQLITGFINALGAFAVEALGTGMQSLKLQTGEQLYVLRYSERMSPIIGIVVAHARDNSVLIRQLLYQTLSEFYTIFQRKLEPSVSTNILDYEEFRHTVDTVLEGKISARTNLKMIIGVIIGLLLMGSILLAFIPIFIELSKANIPDYFAELGFQDVIFSDGTLDPSELHTLSTVTFVVIAALMGFNCIIFLLPTLLASYIAGNKKRGIRTALLLSASVGIFLLLGTFEIEPFGEINAFIWYLVFSPLLISLSILCGFYAGRLKERRKLYPLPGYHKEIL